MFFQPSSVTQHGKNDGKSGGKVTAKRRKILRQSGGIIKRKSLNPLRIKALWLGWLDLNQRMTESKSVALPLGYTPIFDLK
jgi:hypothetical protein